MGLTFSALSIFVLGRWARGSPLAQAHSHPCLGIIWNFPYQPSISPDLGVGAGFPRVTRPHRTERKKGTTLSGAGFQKILYGKENAYAVVQNPHKPQTLLLVKWIHMLGLAGMDNGSFSFLVLGWCDFEKKKIF